MGLQPGLQRRADDHIGGGQQLWSIEEQRQLGAPPGARCSRCRQSFSACECGRPGSRMRSPPTRARTCSGRSKLAAPCRRSWPPSGNARGHAHPSRPATGGAAPAAARAADRHGRAIAGWHDRASAAGPGDRCRPAAVRPVPCSTFAGSGAAPWPTTQARSTRAARPGETWRSNGSDSTRGATSRCAISSASSSSSSWRVCPQCAALPASAAAACGQRWRSSGSTCRRRKLRSAWSSPLLGLRSTAARAGARSRAVHCAGPPAAAAIADAGQGGCVPTSRPGHRRRTPQRTQQEGLGLVVLVLCQCQRFAVAQLGRERCTPGLPRCALKAEACAVVDLHAMHGQFDAQCCALLLAMQHPVIGGRLQAMVHMRTQCRAGKLCAAPQPVQQHGRVDTAAVAHQQRHIQRNRAGRQSRRQV